MTPITLPYPPTINHYWKTRVVQSRGGKAFATHYISQEGKDFRAAVCKQCGGMTGFDGRLSVTVAVFPPDRRIRDLDNLCKALLDALTHAGIWSDDSHIDRLVIDRRGVASGGRVEVMIEQLESMLF